jgi:signal peptidase I
MNFDFPAIMVLAVLFTGVVWLLDVWWFAPRRQAAAPGSTAEVANEGNTSLNEVQQMAAKEPILVEYSKSLFPVILAVLLLRSFLVEPFRIPSGSMMPTLLVGDFILVNKYVYGIRLPVLNQKIIDISSPKRGDVVVFRYPKDTSVDYIKRVIGLPGDKIGYHNKQVYVNGEPLPLEDMKIFEGVGAGVSMSGAVVKQEHINNLTHNILIDNRRPTIEGEFIVPEGRYFAMGDNRDNSNDSRYWGTVPEANLVGKAFMIWMNWDSDNSGVSWSRIGTSIE